MVFEYTCPINLFCKTFYSLPSETRNIESNRIGCKLRLNRKSKYFPAVTVIFLVAKGVTVHEAGPLKSAFLKR